MRVLIAGVGNIFFGDDGFGPAVIQALAGVNIPNVLVADYGIRGLHLAYELLSGYQRAILVDAVPRGGEPGTLYVLEPETCAGAATPDAHRMELSNVFGLMRSIGGDSPKITIVGCEPASVEASMDLSDPVRQSIEPAVALVRRLLDGALMEERHSERTAV